VPRAQIPTYLERAAELAQKHSSLVTGCGHAGDGNVHLSVFQPDAGVREKLVFDLVEAGIEVGGAITGEHGLGRAKAQYFYELADPVVIELMRKLKQAFDPNGILGPGNFPHGARNSDGSDGSSGGNGSDGSSGGTATDNLSNKAN
jgi:glycolate oxidase